MIRAMDLLFNYPFLVAVLLFATGFYMVLAERDLVKKVMGLNIVDTSVFLLIISLGYVAGGAPPILTTGGTTDRVVNPIPSALILTGIVVAVSVSAYALGLIREIYRLYGTLDIHQIDERVTRE